MRLVPKWIQEKRRVTIDPPPSEELFRRKESPITQIALNSTSKYCRSGKLRESYFRKGLSDRVPSRALDG